MKRATVFGIAVLLGVAMGACGDTVTIGEQLLGTWNLAAFDDHGTVGTTTGTWTFREDGLFWARGTVTFPDEPTDSLSVDGTWQEFSTSAIELTVGADVSIWAVRVAGDSAVLSLTDQEGTVRITLTRSASLAVVATASRSPAPPPCSRAHPASWPASRRCT
jgi:hypothetical protein